MVRTFVGPTHFCALLLGNTSSNPSEEPLETGLHDPEIVAVGEDAQQGGACAVKGGCVAPDNPHKELCPCCKTKLVHDACWRRIPLALESCKALRIRGACSSGCLLQLLQQDGSPAAKALRRRLVAELEKQMEESEKPLAQTQEPKPQDDDESRKKPSGRKGKKRKKNAEAEPEDDRPRPSEGLEYCGAGGACAFDTLKEWVLQSQPRYSLSGTVEENEKYRDLLSRAALYTNNANVVKHNNRPPVLLRSRAFVEEHVDELRADFARAKLNAAVLVIEDAAESEALRSLVSDDKLKAAEGLRVSWLQGDVYPLHEEIDAEGEAAIYAFTLCGNHSTAALASLVSDGLETSGGRPAYVYFRSQLSDFQFSFLAGHENALESQRSQLTANYTTFAEPLHVIPFIRDLWVEKGRPPPQYGREYAGASSPYSEFQETLNR